MNLPRQRTLLLIWPEREADHSPPYNADFKNAWSYTSSWRGALLGTGTNLTSPLPPPTIGL